jgi:CubicO group peptidase (beta-lactamase class C family)
MTTLGDAVDAVAARTGFSGVVRVDRGDEVELESVFGLADRAHAIPLTPDTRLAIASGAKGLTALTVVSLIDEGVLGYETEARSVLGADLPLIEDDVTVEHLLAHRSGIGDYLDEEAIDDIAAYLMPVPVHELATTEDYVRILDGHRTAFAAGERFAYNNGGYVVLALIAERATGTPFHDLVDERVCAPAGMTRTAFLRSDRLPGDAGLGYLDDGLWTNVLHLPVRGSGDGGVFTTAADLRSFWRALWGGRIVPDARVAEMVAPRSDDPVEGRRYGMGFWLRAEGDVVYLEGYDAGVSFRSVHDPARDLTHTVIANTSEGAWDVTGVLAELLGA